MITLIDIIQKLKSLIPEGEFRTYLKRKFGSYYIDKLYNQALNDTLRDNHNNVKVKLDANAASIHFNGLANQLQNQEIIFPKTDILDARWLIIDTLLCLSGYFGNTTVSQGSVVIDAGSFPGDYATIAARMTGKTGKVFAFEPDPDNRLYLEEVLKCNSVNQIVKIMPYALTDRTGFDYLSIHQRGHGSHLDGGRGIQVETITLDDFLLSEGLLKQDCNRKIMIKMDIEGAEVQALKGAASLLSSGSVMDVTFAIAAYHMVNGRMTAGDVIDIFKKYPYSAHRAFEQHLTVIAQSSGKRQEEHN